jgi:iron complex outermembrane receptor protein
VRGTFDFAAFYNDFRNQQLQVGFYPAPGVAVGPTTGIVNAGRSRIYGAVGAPRMYGVRVRYRFGR